ncbi:MAG: hypothetical protein ABSB15_03870 [Bryobacteraceae bacterium]|jgi:hypothetical protein
MNAEERDNHVGSVGNPVMAGRCREAAQKSEGGSDAPQAKQNISIRLFIERSGVTDIKHARQLLDHLAPDQVAAVVHVMEVMLDPVSRALGNAPLEDEEISAEEEQSIAEAREWLKRNNPIPHEEVLAEFGLTMADFERMGRTPLPNAPNGSATK